METDAPNANEPAGFFPVQPDGLVEEQPTASPNGTLVSSSSDATNGINDEDNVPSETDVDTGEPEKLETNPAEATQFNQEHSASAELLAEDEKKEEPAGVDETKMGAEIEEQVPGGQESVSEETVEPEKLETSSEQIAQPNRKRSTSSELVTELLGEADQQDKSAEASSTEAKRPRTHQDQVSATAIASYQSRVLPNWMKRQGTSDGPPTQPSLKPPPLQVPTASSTLVSSSQPRPPQFVRNHIYNVPHAMEFPQGFTPTWRQMLPPLSLAPTQQITAHNVGPRVYQLSLLNVKEFTIQGLPPTPDAPPTPVTGLRKPLRQMCRPDKPEYTDSRWRIPLSAYHAVFSYLQQLPSRVYGIPANQLQIATLERERQDKGYPTPEALMEAGVPEGLSKALSPFQRGGVDFVRAKGGRALVADDMGLGKTIQGVASMSLYREDWPVLVLCPSGARYHWEKEFRQWLGINSKVNKRAALDSVFVDADQSNAGGLLQNWQINVLVSSKGKLLPRKGTKIVICSYGLVVTLIRSGRLKPGMFGCAIVDESHMLKNKSSKRTLALTPILQSTKRCVLLSGTPALAKPEELWPQLSMLNCTGSQGWDISEAEFMRKYVKSEEAGRSAELHTMLTGTVMIRRLKTDILKELPHKLRQKGRVRVVTSEMKPRFDNLMLELRQGKGALGKLAKIHEAEFNKDGLDIVQDDELPPSQAERLQAEMQEKFERGRARIGQQVMARAGELNREQMYELRMHLEGNLRTELELDRQNRLKQSMETNDSNRKTNVLTQLYTLTGEAKIPLIVNMLNRWLSDTTKGKVCIFAHHISVLDAIERECNLSNKSKNRKFIRIDGSTSPKSRQEQISAFQGEHETEHNIRVALLGITAAGVAVTLTASSTVWFAELFWTPALMIQAEDRCHRIGQTARVNCLYIVAKGTLDDVLWKLIEKKFRDLGEFVEGKERLKLVVEQTFESTKELYADLFAVEEGGDDEDDLKMDVDLQEFFDDDLANDIEALGERERQMVDQDVDMDESDPLVDGDSKPAAEPSTGYTEDNAIALLDDDDPHEDGASSTTTAVRPSAYAHGSATAEPNPRPVGANGILADCRLYKLIMWDSSLGVELRVYNGRVFVNSILPPRLRELGADSKPAVGDILVSINGTPVELVPDLYTTINTLRYHLRSQQPLQLVFVYAPRFVQALLRWMPQPQVPTAPAPPASTTGDRDEVIELLDDD